MAYDGPGGAIFKNNKKQKDTHPDLTGFIELSDECVASIKEQIGRGVKYPKIELSAWSKVSQKGNKFMSLSAKKPWEAQSGGGNGGGYSQNNSRSDDLNDEIPF